MSNIDRLRTAMRGANTGALLVSNMENVRWLTGFTGSFGLVVLTPDAGVFITDSRYTLQAQEEVRGLPSETFSSPVESTDFLKQQVERLGITDLAFEGDTVTFATYERWRDKLAPVQLKPAPDILAPLRMVKDSSEIDKIRTACKIADHCFDHVLRLIRPGATELDIALEIEFFFRRQGLALAFEPIAVSGERSARPHGKPSDKMLEMGDFLTMDFGCKFEGYCSDITRTVVVGEANDEHRRIYNRVLKAQMAALEAMKPGKQAAEIDALARRVLDEEGLAKYFGHGLGHGLGSVVHDHGRMNSTSPAVLQPGQVWTVEPGVYIEGFGGVRIEDDVVVTEAGIEILTHSTKELLVLP
jgi:Xaa-Pro aminopeptidase